MEFSLPYGKGFLTAWIPDGRVNAVLLPKMHGYRPDCGQAGLVARAMERPIGSPTLNELAAGKKKVVLLASDHTRPVPSRILVPQMLDRIRAGNPSADITILIATGCHRGTTRAELLDKFGPEILEREKILVHDCDDERMLADIGALPSGGRLVLNRLAAEADLLISEGFIEPHFFAGFSGGRKSVLPGVAGRQTVLYNHNAGFISNDRARTGMLEGNPIHEDMIFAARAAGLKFIVNVVINAGKEIIGAFAGDCDLAHRRGVAFLRGLCGVRRAPADIVVTTNGGYPLDQNIYQAVKGMTAAEAAVNPGGVIIMLAQSGDGHGGEHFRNAFQNEKDEDKLLSGILATKSGDTLPDQWQAQIFARVLKKARVVYLSGAPDRMVSDLHMTPAHSFAEALEQADRILGKKDAKITVIPDGVSVIVT